MITYKLELIYYNARRSCLTNVELCIQINESEIRETKN